MLMSKSSIGLPDLKWQSFEVSVGTAATRLFPPQLAISEWNSGLGQQLFEVGGGGANQLKWLKPGMTIVVAGIASAEGKHLNQKHTVLTVDEATGTFTTKPASIIAKNPIVVNGVEAGTINLIGAWAQKAYIVVPAAGATVTIAPSAEMITNGYGFRKPITAGNERELTAPSGARFNVGDWYANVAAGTQTVQILFI